MENCVVQEITSIDEYLELCDTASKSNHPNASNYKVDKMRKRWDKYLIFTKLTRGDELISFAGIVDFGNNLVRVADRLYTKQEYRQNFMSKKVVNPLRPAVDYIIPYHTKWAVDKGYNCFYSIQELKKRNSLIRTLKLLNPDLGYSVLPNLYATCNPENPRCWQNIASTTKNIHLQSKPIL